MIDSVVRQRDRHTDSHVAIEVAALTQYMHQAAKINMF